MAMIGNVALDGRQNKYAHQYRFFDNGLGDIKEENKKKYWFSSRIGWNVLAVREEYLSEDQRKQGTIEQDFKKETGWDMKEIEEICPARMEFIFKGFIKSHSKIYVKAEIDTEMDEDHMRLYVPNSMQNIIEENKIVEGTKIVDIAGNKYVIDIVMDKLGLITTDAIIAKCNPNLVKRKNARLFKHNQNALLLYIMENANDLSPTTKLKFGISAALLERSKDYNTMIEDLKKLTVFNGINSLITIKYFHEAYDKHIDIVRSMVGTTPSKEMTELRNLSRNTGRRNCSIAKYYDKYMKHIGLDKIREYAYTDIGIEYNPDLPFPEFGISEIEDDLVIPNPVGWSMFMQILDPDNEDRERHRESQITKVSKRLTALMTSPIYDMSAYIMAIPNYTDTNEVILPKRILNTIGIEDGDEFAIARYPVHTGNNVQRAIAKESTSSLSQYVAKVPIWLMNLMDGDFDGDRVVIYKLPKKIMNNCDWAPEISKFNSDKYSLISKLFGANNVQEIDDKESEYVINRMIMKRMTPLAASIGRIQRWYSKCKEDLIDANRNYWEYTNSVLNTKTLKITKDMEESIIDKINMLVSKDEINEVIVGNTSVLEIPDFVQYLMSKSNSFWAQTMCEGLASITNKWSLDEMFMDITNDAVSLWDTEFKDVFEEYAMIQKYQEITNDIME